MTIDRTGSKTRLRHAALLCVLALGGCADGVELNGKIFDLMGVSPAAQAAAQAKAEPKMANRAGLIPPPDPSRLPEPGSGDTETSAAALAAVDDPDRKKQLAAAERARLHKSYCAGEINWKERIADPSATPTSPYGPCTFIGNALKQN